MQQNNQLRNIDEPLKDNFFENIFTCFFIDLHMQMDIHILVIYIPF